MKEKKVEKKYPRFISNNPCGEDLFEGKSHEKIADCIVEQLKDNENCNIIGIEGSWGSGKSNLVKLIKTKLQEKKDKKETSFYVYTYDVWGYQNDYLRRSVLENLMTFLIENDDGPHFCKDWDDSLKRLLSRKETIGSRIVKEINVFTKLSIIMSLTFVAFTFIKDLYFRNFYDNNQWFKISITLTFFSIYILLLLINWKSYSKKYGDKDVTFFKWIFHSYYDFKNDTQTSEDSISTNTVYEAEASTREFKDYVKSINKKLKNNRLIIVFDNIDRLPVDKVKEVWAMINILFANDDTPNINVVVPFDRNHIISAFKEENIEINQQNDNGESNQTTMVSYGNDFINKTFNVVFRVSPPTMNNWKSFFRKEWNEAFNKDEDVSVLQIYDLLSKTNQSPRNIIAFINEFVSIRKIFSEDSIPDAYIALFIFGKKEIQKDPDKEIIIPSYLGNINYLYKNDTDLPKYISALYYQLDPEKALDIIYTQQVIQALNKNLSDKLKEIKKLPEFYNILQHAISEISNVENAVLTLDECLGNEKSKYTQNIWDSLVRKISHEEPNAKQYQEILLANISKKNEYLRKIIFDFQNTKNFKIEDYYNSISYLFDINNNDINVDKCLTKKNVNPEDYINFLELAKDDYKRYKIECNTTEFDDYLSKLPIDVLKKLSAIKYLKLQGKDNKDTYPLYLNHLHESFNQNKANKTNVFIIIERLKELERPITCKLDDQYITTFFSTTAIQDEAYIDLLCMRLSKLNSFQSNNMQIFTNACANIQDDFVLSVCEKINSYISFSELLVNIEIMKTNPLYIAVCKNLITTKKGIQANIGNLIKNYEKIKKYTNLEPDKILNCFEDWNKYIGDNIDKENITDIPIVYFDDAKVINNDNYKYCKKIAIDYLSELLIEQWENAIINKGNDALLLISIQGKIENAFEALKNCLNKYANGEIAGLDKEIISKLIQLSLNNRRSLKSLFNNIRDVFCNGRLVMNANLFNFWGKWLFDYSDLTKKEESIRTILPTSILDNDSVIEIIIQYPSIIKQMISLNEEESQDFIEKVRSLLEGKYKEDEDFIKFAYNIGITMQKKTEKEN